MVKLLICGGGNGSHVYAGIASSQPNVEARVLTLYADEAERWTNTMKENDFTTVVHKDKGVKVELKTKPKLVTKDPKLAAEGVDIIVMVVPAFAHAQYLNALKPYITKGQILCGMPGQSGFEFAARSILGDLTKSLTLINFESLPWICRLSEFGKTVDCLGTKTTMNGSLSLGDSSKGDPVALFQSTIGEVPKLECHGHLVGISLISVNGYLHPTIMYGQWSQWDGKPLDESPIFYQGIDDNQANLLTLASKEVCAIASHIANKCQVDMSNVQSLHEYFMRTYSTEIPDKTNLKTCLRTNPGFEGLRHPCTKTADGKLVPDFKHRYLLEDIPFGLAVIRGVAAVAEVPTPVIDKILMWAQKVTGTEYLVDGEFKGKDIAKSRAPQAYGFNTLDAVLSS